MLVGVCHLSSRRLRDLRVQRHLSQRMFRAEGAQDRELLIRPHLHLWTACAQLRAPPGGRAPAETLLLPEVLP